MASDLTPQQIFERQQNRLKLQLQKQGGTQQMELEKAKALQQQQLEAERQRALDAADAERKKALDQVEIQRQQGLAALRSAGDKKQFEYEQSQLPFSQQHPNITAALPWVGMAGAFASPYAIRIAKQLYQNGVIREWRDALPAAEKLLKSTADKTKRSAAITELQNYGNAIPKEGPTAGKMGTALSALLPGELNVIPTIMDAATLDPSKDPNKPGAREIARSELMDPREWLSRVPLGMAGATFAGLGNKLPLAMSREIPPAARTAGLTAAMSAMPKNAPKAPKKPPAGLPDAPSPMDRPAAPRGRKAAQAPGPPPLEPPAEAPGESWAPPPGRGPMPPQMPPQMPMQGPPTDIPAFLAQRGPMPPPQGGAGAPPMPPQRPMMPPMPPPRPAPHHHARMQGQTIMPGPDGMYRYPDGRPVLPNVDFGHNAMPF